MTHNMPPRVLLLAPTTTYRLHPFLEAAGRLGIEVVVGDDRCHMLAEQWGDDSLYMEFSRPKEALETVLEFCRKNPVDTILPVDDRTVKLAAEASVALNLRHNRPDAADAARNKYLMRLRFAESHVRSPTFTKIRLDTPPDGAAARAVYPCVLKPLHLNGSRGVIRADNPDEFIAAYHRLNAILRSAKVRVSGEPEWEEYLVEEYVPGIEVALEGLLVDGELHVLALFDKPDPLDGPFFEESLYVTPSRLTKEEQREIIECAARAASALGLREGPVHAEIRINDEGAWIIEMAARSIGGKCSKALRFGTGLSLEEVLLSQAVLRGSPIPERERQASGVMMLPIPCRGLLKQVNGIERAADVQGIVEIDILIRVGQWVEPLPEGNSYLGFVFARSETPYAVERALRRAKSLLEIKIAPSVNAASFVPPAEGCFSSESKPALLQECDS